MGRESRIGRDRPTWGQWDTGNGAIHSFGEVRCDTEYYQAGDWITFEIDMGEFPSCTIYKNGKQVAYVNELPFEWERARTDGFTDDDSSWEESRDSDSDYKENEDVEDSERKAMIAAMSRLCTGLDNDSGNEAAENGDQASVSKEKSKENLKVCQKAEQPEQQNQETGIYFCVVVDDRSDVLFVEQVMIA